MSLLQVNPKIDSRFLLKKMDYTINNASMYTPANVINFYAEEYDTQFTDSTNQRKILGSSSVMLLKVKSIETKF